MRNLWFLLFFLFLISCTPQNKTDKFLIEEFENILGEPETTYLNEIVEDFEIYLDSNYDSDDIESKYKFYLSELVHLKLDVFWKIDSVKMTKYLESNLFGKYDSIYPDSVWFENDMINLKFYKHEFLNESIIPIRRNKLSLNIDSMIIYHQKEPKFWQTTPSRYYVALDSIKKNDVFIHYCLEMMMQPEWSNNRGIAYELLNMNPDFSNYFVKRIVSVETRE